MFIVRFALLSSFFYALNVSMLPLIYSLEVSAFLFLFIRFATTFCSSLLITKSFFSFTKIKKHKIGFWLIILSFLFGIQSWFFVEAVKYMSVGLASVILYTYPLITYLMVSLSKRRALDLTTIVMFILATIGIVAISQSSEGVYMLVIGIVLSLLSAISLSLIFFLTPKVSSLRNWEIVKFTTLIPMLMFLALFLNESGISWPANEGIILSLISGTLFATGMFFYHMAVKKYGPTRTANVGYSEPLMVLIIGFIVYSDSITNIQAIGIILVTIASITIERRQLSQDNTPKV
ncbi:MAG: DMT family transporter [Candidatus Thioglobus sp.]|nr:DMT family transporter [Candidatus Thioglobus sp.]